MQRFAMIGLVLFCAGCRTRPAGTPYVPPTPEQAAASRVFVETTMGGVAIAMGVFLFVVLMTKGGGLRALDEHPDLATDILMYYAIAGILVALGVGKMVTGT